ncbi:MAG: TM0106 family RecB-like putative nuclease [Candidatus Omnitrophica bacterium]|nr:TM0106 family RecB-like putative nuclease [Candidatus Omnitrophota bacterium]MDD5488298.1 TM0106 family RecB-like putative nuclease [Candidatus Omnitrophota bacterium]
MTITASKLYNYIQCPHRVWRDIYGPQNEKQDEENAFLQLIWDRGVLHEKEIIESIGKYTDISGGTFEERIEKTKKAMDEGAELIYQGVIEYEDMMGIPDLLKKDGDKYIPIDIKSGRGYGDFSENGEEKLKKHYAVQLCLYVDILQKLGYASKNKGIIIDGHGEEVEYDLDLPMGKKDLRTYWQYYEEIKAETRKLIADEVQNIPALGSVCKMCIWYTSCKKWCYGKDDLTKLFYLGRSKRDALNDVFGIMTTKQMSEIDLETILTTKKLEKDKLKGMQLGDKTLTQIHKRAQVLNNEQKPVFYEPISFPEVDAELYLDIEDDPMRGIVYLHGIYEKIGDKERFVAFVAKSTDEVGEKQAFKELWDYLKSFEDKSHAVYYYSSHEKTTYKALAGLYPDIVTPEEVETYFNQPHIIDLYYEAIYSKTDWPLPSYSLKEIATYLGFKWRDETPSGALSIKWYNEYCETKDESILNRILEYNEDDCKASMVIKQELERMSK